MLKSKLYNGAGPRNNYITLQRASSQTANDVSEVLPQYKTIGQYFAAYKPRSSKEFMAAMTVQPNLASVLELPYDSVTSTLTPRDRILDGDRVQHIDSVYNEFENNEKIIVWILESALPDA